MKKTLLMLVLLLPLLLHAQNEVVFGFSDGIGASPLKTRLEQNVSRLLTAINVAEASGNPIDYTGILMDSAAARRIDRLWQCLRFRVLDDDLVEHCLPVKTSSGSILYYQVRNIAIEMRPVDSGYVGDRNSEIALTFTPDGTIADLCVTLGLQRYVRLMKEGEKMGDINNRMQIIHWLEQYVTAYYSKDIELIEKAYNVQDFTPQNDISGQYVSQLKRMFRRNDFINVKVDELEIIRHATKPNYYGVTLKHGWFNKHYSDAGSAFWVWTFEDESRPKPMISIMQPLETDEDQIFTLVDFKLE